MAVADPTRVDFGKVYTPDELESTLNNLSDVGKLKLCEGELFISSDSDITVKVFGNLYDIAENFASNKNKVLELMLPSSNDNLPKINGRNIVRKYNSVLAKAKNLSEEEKLNC